MAHAMTMLAVVLGMFLCLAAGAAVVGYVAIAARREGREVLTEEGEHLVASVRERGERMLHRRSEPAEIDSVDTEYRPSPGRGEIISTSRR